MNARVCAIGGRIKRPWMTSEVEILHELLAVRCRRLSEWYAMAAERLQRTASGVQERCRRLGIRPVRTPTCIVCGEPGKSHKRCMDRMQQPRIKAKRRKEAAQKRAATGVLT